MIRARVVAALALLVAGTASGHGGGLNAEGCHHDRKNGGYHCHRGPSAPAPRDDLGPMQRLGPGGGGNRPFANCAEARAAGAAPVHRGEPGYGAHLDRDNDGIGCEPYRGRR